MSPRPARHPAPEAAQPAARRLGGVRLRALRQGGAALSGVRRRADDDRRELNPKLFLVARQNDSENDALFRSARLDLVMQRARAISRRILALITAPLLTA